MRIRSFAAAILAFGIVTTTLHAQDLASFEKRTSLVGSTFERTVMQLGTSLTVNHADISQCCSKTAHTT